MADMDIDEELRKSAQELGALLEEETQRKVDQVTAHGRTPEGMQDILRLIRADIGEMLTSMGFEQANREWMFDETGQAVTLSLGTMINVLLAVEKLEDELRLPTKEELALKYQAYSATLLADLGREMGLW